MRELRARLTRAEQRAGCGTPLFLVSFEDGSKRKMMDIDLYLYSIRLNAFLEEPNSLIIADLPTVTDYKLIRGDLTAIADCVLDEIQTLKGAQS